MVLADGVFDPLHVGHIWYLREAAKLGRPLFVNVAPDDAILAKGRKPFQNRTERMLTVMALDMVDNAYGMDLPEIIRTMHPHMLVKGKDWRDKLPDAVLAACQAVGAEIRYTDTQERTSTERLAG